MNFNNPIEIASNIYWVGHYLEGDPFQCHPYLIVNGDESILIDPGSVIEFEMVIKKIKELIPLNHVKYIVLHHQDPDLAASVPAIEKLIDRDDLQIITHSRMSLLIQHYGITSKYYEIDKNNFLLKTNTGLELKFLMTPYCHSPGAFVSYEIKNKVLFSSDIFGGLEESWKFYADENYFEDAKAFHETFMPSRDIFNYTLTRIENLDLELIAPQHGSIIKKEYIENLIKKLKNLDCGLYIDEKYHTELNKTVKKLKLEIEKNRKKDTLLMEQAKLAQMGEMMNMVAHQWRQPLNVVAASALNLSLLNSIGGLTDEELEKTTSFIQEQIQKMSETINDFMEFNKEVSEDEILLQESVLNVEKMIISQLKNRSIKLIVDIDSDVSVFHNKTSVEHSIMNLISNARDAYDGYDSEDEKVIKIYTKSDIDGEIDIFIEDNAGGIPKNIINKIFNPYFTTKEQGKGTGIGLYMTRKMIEEVEGSSIDVKSSNDGTIFKIKFVKGRKDD
ncbi:MAG: ATP-binding protein [Campylobacterota bacterium]|nr:ATP-binding protein [Campylobacterota bacterium]